MKVLEARDYIFSPFLVAWNPVHKVVWTDQPDNVPDTIDPWARVTLHHSIGRQSSLSNELGKRLFTNEGTLVIQVFAPMNDSLNLCYSLAQSLIDIYSAAHSDDVWFRFPRIREIGPSGDFMQVNVLVDFNYDDVR